MNVRSLVLASQSPRRRQILSLAGFEFDILPSQISEIPDENLNLAQQIRQLAHDKAEACLKMRKPLKGQGVLILAADTMVALAGQTLGKPKDENQARQFLKQLSGETHVVLTGLSLYDVDTDTWAESVVETKVYFRELTAQEIEHYVRSGDPMDKAGGYGIQGEAGAFVQRIEGPFDNVVGLPIDELKRLLVENRWQIRRRVSSVQEGLLSIRQQISNACVQFHRAPSSVKLIAVSKTKSAEAVMEAVLADQLEFGENYVQEAVDKQVEIAQLQQIAGVDRKVSWHFIGGLQSKKVKAVVGSFALIHSVDRESLVLEIEKRAAERQIVQNILLQVNIANEETKSGASAQDFASLVDVAGRQPHIRICGVMALPPLVEDEAVARRQFAEVRAVFELAKRRLSIEQQRFFTEMSMGTTHDFTAAIAEGATMVRVGTAIFGERQ